MSPLVLAVCTAYESGFGQGFEGRATANPYAMGALDTFEAWEFGHQQGTQRREREATIPQSSNLQLDLAGLYQALAGPNGRADWLRSEYLDGGGIRAMTREAWDAAIASTRSPEMRAVAHSLAPETPAPLNVGDVLVERDGYGSGYLCCGSGIYPCAIVVSIYPFVMVSEEGDMMWGCQKPEHFKVHSRATPDQSRAAFDRYMRRGRWAPSPEKSTEESP